MQYVYFETEKMVILQKPNKLQGRDFKKLFVQLSIHQLLIRSFGIMPCRREIVTN